MNNYIDLKKKTCIFIFLFIDKLTIKILRMLNIEYLNSSP